MNRRSYIRTGAWLLLGLLLTVSPVLAQRTYLGADSCSACHEDHTKWAQGSAHYTAAVPGGPAKGQKGCETCHGPGSEHAESPDATNIITFRTETAEVRSQQCLSCHAALNPGTNFRRSDHASRKVACDQCHRGKNSEAFHRMRVTSEALAGGETALCLSCHPAQRADFSLPFRHPVKEGFMKCSSCHEPHGGYTVRQMRTRAGKAVCGECHPEKQGPFVFEHSATKTAGCQSCHRPHGGTNARLLTRHDVRTLCLECHTNTPAFHDLSQARYRNCTVCHSRVHGSNLNRHLLE